MFRIIRTLINIVVGIIELLLSIRLIFKFLVVNADTPFVVWIYGITARLVAPFAKILRTGNFRVSWLILPPLSRLLCMF